MTSQNSYNYDPRFHYYNHNPQHPNYNPQYPNYNLQHPYYNPQYPIYILQHPYYSSQYPIYNPQNPNDNPDVINAQNTQLQNFVDPTTSFTPKPADYATDTSSITNYGLTHRKAHHVEYHQMESVANRSNVMTYDVGTTGNYFEESHHGFQMQTSTNSTDGPGQSNDNVMKESINFEAIQYYEMQCSSANRSKNIQNCDDVTEENNNWEVHLVEENNNLAKDITNVEVQPAKDITNEELQPAKNITNGEQAKNITNVEAHQAKDITNGEVQKIQSSSTDNTDGNDASVTARKVENAEFSCDPCGKVFKKRGYLKQHNDAIHNADKLHKCGKCSKRFYTEDECKKHYEKHYGEKPFPCNEKDCDKTFHYKIDLRRHSRTHTKELFFCPTCGKGFTRRTHQEFHQKRHLQKKTKRIRG